MSQDLVEILEKLNKLNIIESSLKNKSPEERREVLESFRKTVEKEITDLKEGTNFTRMHLSEQKKNIAKAQAEISKLNETVRRTK